MKRPHVTVRRVGDEILASVRVPVSGEAEAEDAGRVLFQAAARELQSRYPAPGEAA